MILIQGPKACPDKNHSHTLDPFAYSPEGRIIVWRCPITGRRYCEIIVKDADGIGHAVATAEVKTGRRRAS